MKNVIRVRTVIVAVALGITALISAAQTGATPPSSQVRPGAEETSNPPAPAQTDAAVMQRLAELEKEVERLRDELQAVKTAPAGAATLRPAVYALPDGTPAAAAAPAAAAPAQAAAPAPAKPDPLAG